MTFFGGLLFADRFSLLFFFCKHLKIFWWSFRPQILTAITDAAHESLGFFTTQCLKSSIDRPKSKRARSRFAIKEVLTQAETNNFASSRIWRI